MISSLRFKVFKQSQVQNTIQLFRGFATLQELNQIQIRNPLTNQVVYEKQELSLDQIISISKDGKKSQNVWSKLPLQDRKKVCQNFNDILKEKSEDISKNISQFTSKPIKESQLEVKATIHRIKSLIDMSDEALKDEILENQVKKGKKFIKFISKHPVGTVLIISPWNYPLLTASSVLMTSLLAGNNVLLKPSPQTVGVADDIEQIFEQAASSISDQFKNLVKNVYTSNLKNFQTLYKYSQYVSFTGSIQTGLKVQKECIDANPWANCVLELGGKDAAYIHKSCLNYLDDVVKQIIIGCFTNSGQSCCAIERVYCDSEILELFQEKLLAAVQNIKVLEINKKETLNNNQSQIEVGPLTLKNHAQFIKKQVDKAIQQGATVLNQKGGSVIEFPLTDFNQGDQLARLRGYFPTILTNVTNQMDIVQEETFGPVLPIIKVEKGYEQAISLINDSKYGLTASIFSNNQQIVQEMSNKLNVGTVLVNQCLMMDPLLPWIGWNQSGKNYSLSKHGFDQVTKMKSHNQIFYE
ncbi:NAD-dependent aldehyde dehydrogenase family protein (macronuclear) [Tetrahymena thermophila SB210]|uniref:NAD-dependent aldehyde dehydrogenase family protein n=1 Tax=Tetrahymena thermophila (strain SB210) TaxID=312017 RepID=Q23DF4_TETTS|nr:NAD-dependent aldehyde dehydrogenase family protein [Tetrahymena thermophila SB210]EAR94502.1 NAD-dependent aldehyde dehydrogenase family protein [Tetrahymena thermophila SB210]|eukprot:XP_001014732.1 NAD-dependent aldehyde dehydrogenase family protein [Tetrahymena thermophila SB210]